MPVPVTSSWSVKLPETYARIGISRGPPRGQHGYRLYRPLMPGSWFKSATATEFRRLYMDQLAALDPQAVLQDLAALAGGRTPVLLCFERPPPNPAWCHRGLVSVWFWDRLHVRIAEYGHEEAGWGWAHPKLPAAWRNPGRRTGRRSEA
jgi:hypothetical protein